MRKRNGPAFRVRVVYSPVVREMLIFLLFDFINKCAFVLSIVDGESVLRKCRTAAP